MTIAAPTARSQDGRPPETFSLIASPTKSDMGMRYPRARRDNPRDAGSRRAGTSPDGTKGREPCMADENADRAREEAERYRQAAEDALQQLDWCIGYLHGIRKIGISRALSRNRSYIRTNLMRTSEEPLPTEQVTSE